MTAALVIRNEGGHTRRVGARGVAIVEEMARDGCSQTTIAKRLRVAESTFREIKRRQPEVSEALERGYSAMEDELVCGLMERFRSGILNPSDKGAITAAIFLLKTRRGYEGTRLPGHLTVINDNRTQQIALPSAEDMEQYMRRVVDGSPEPLPSERPGDA